MPEGKTLRGLSDVPGGLHKVRRALGRFGFDVLAVSRGSPQPVLSSLSVAEVSTGSRVRPCEQCRAGRYAPGFIQHVARLVISILLVRLGDPLCLINS